MNMLEIEGGNSGDGFLCGTSMRYEHKSLKQLDRGWDDALCSRGFGWVFVGGFA